MNKEDIEAKLKSIIEDVDEPVAKTEEDKGLKNKHDAFVDGLKSLTEVEKKIDEDYKELVLKKKEYDAPTDEDIEKLAEKSVGEKYEGQKEILGDKKNLAVEELENKKLKLELNNEESKKALKSAYDEAKDEVSKQAIRRGIARSSIVLERLSKLDANKIQDLFELDEKTFKDISDIDGEIKRVENEYKSAVKGLDVNMALDKSEKIDELKKEREKKIEEALEYNNTIDEKLVKFYNSTVDLRNSSTQKLADDEALKERYVRALKYYYGMNPVDALNEFNSDYEVQSLLGDKYSKLVERYLTNWYEVTKKS